MRVDDKTLSAILDITGITEADIRSIDQSFIRLQWIIKTWNHRTFYINAEQLACFDYKYIYAKIKFSGNIIGDRRNIAGRFTPL